MFQKCKITNAREVAQFTEKLKQKIQVKAQGIKIYTEGQASTSKIVFSKKI